MAEPAPAETAAPSPKTKKERSHHKSKGKRRQSAGTKEAAKPSTHAEDKPGDQTGVANVQPSTHAEDKLGDQTGVVDIRPPTNVEDKPAEQGAGSKISTAISKKRRMTNTEGESYLSRKITTAGDDKGHGLLIAAVGILVLLAMVAAGALFYRLAPRRPPRSVEICTTKGCDLHGSALYRAINHDVKPCDDFHSHVCGSWGDVLREVTTEEDMMSDALDMYGRAPC